MKEPYLLLRKAEFELLKAARSTTSDNLKLEDFTRRHREGSMQVKFRYNIPSPSDIPRINAKDLLFIEATRSDPTKHISYDNFLSEENFPRKEINKRDHLNSQFGLSVKELNFLNASRVRGASVALNDFSDEYDSMGRLLSTSAKFYCQSLIPIPKDPLPECIIGPFDLLFLEYAKNHPDEKLSFGRFCKEQLVAPNYAAAAADPPPQYSARESLDESGYFSPNGSPSRHMSSVRRLVAQDRLSPSSPSTLG